jgi:rRNA-processing protein FCF1
MKSEDLVLTGVLLVLLGEVTYLVAKLPRQAGGKKQYIFVDTSVLIDGRIMAVATSGFITGTLAIPRSVIGELQFLADNADPEKRTRARHGLDIARELQEIPGLDVQLFQDGTKAEEGVDNRLLELAKQYKGAICTIDYNLNKVATVEGIPVCNVNELAKNLRMAYLPGERIMLELVQKGQDSHQGVGYLPDGTMVVVEQASAQVGQAVEIEFIRSLQTAAGKMMFAKKVESKKSDTQSAQPVKQVQKRAVRPQPRQGQKPSGTRPPQQNGPTQNAQQNTHQSNRNQGNQNQNNQRSRRRPPSSSQREAALIDLVEKQQ